MRTFEMNKLCHSKGISSIWCIHLPPSVVSWLYKQMDLIPTNAYRVPVTWMEKWVDGICWFLLKKFFLIGFLVGMSLQKMLIYLFATLFHFILWIKIFLVNFWFSWLIIIMAKFNPKIPWVGRQGEITCSLLISHEL